MHFGLMNMSMKIPRASILAALSLSLALCACDSGDKIKDSAAPLPPKKPKAEGESGNAANPQSADANETAKKMNEPAAPAELGDLSASADMPAVKMINNAIKVYNQKKSADLMAKKMPLPGAGGGQAAAKAAYENANKKQAGAASTTLTSLDDLVKSGLMKSLPAPPEGKKFLLDVQKQEVTLVNK